MTVVRELGLTSQQVWGLTKTDHEWSTALSAARRDEGEHNTNAAYANACVCGTAGSTSNGEAGTVAVEVCDAEVNSVVSTNAAASFWVCWPSLRRSHLQLTLPSGYESWPAGQSCQLGLGTRSPFTVPAPAAAPTWLALPLDRPGRSIFN